MERQLFTWTGWDGDMSSMIFYNPVLIKEVGKFPVGTKFSSAALSYESGKLEFYDEACSVLATYQLHLSVGQEIEHPCPVNV